MQEWLRLQAERALTGAAALWMRTSRPAEELYDTVADPHQIRNLAAEMPHRETLERMRKAVTDWMARTNDQGLINEAEMIQRMWPGGMQPETAQPYILPRRETDAPSRRASIAITAPMEVVIYVPTQGASIGYTTEEGPAAKWRLYTGPIRVEAPMTLRAKAIRYGYKESAETRTVFTVKNGRKGAKGTAFRHRFPSTCCIRRPASSSPVAGMISRTICPSCGNAGLTRIERVIQGTQILLSYYCGACEHVWQIPDASQPASAGQVIRAEAAAEAWRYVIIAPCESHTPWRFVRDAFFGVPHLRATVRPACERRGRAGSGT